MMEIKNLICCSERVCTFDCVWMNGIFALREPNDETTIVLEKQGIRDEKRKERENEYCLCVCEQLSMKIKQNKTTKKKQIRLLFYVVWMCHFSEFEYEYAFGMRYFH